MDYNGQPRLTAQDVGAVSLLEEIYHVKGTAVTELSRPSWASLLTLHCEVAHFRMKPGSHNSLSAADPSASVSDGTGSLKLGAGEKLTIPAPTVLTVVGSAAGSILTYYWS